MEIIGKSGGGLVTIKMSGNHRVPVANGVILDPNLLKEEKGVMEDLIAAAINDAVDKIERQLSDKMGGISGMKLPDGLG